MMGGGGWIRSAKAFGANSSLGTPCISGGDKPIGAPIFAGGRGTEPGVPWGVLGPGPEGGGLLGMFAVGGGAKPVLPDCGVPGLLPGPPMSDFLLFLG